MKKKFKSWLTSILAGVSALSIFGGVLPMLAPKTASAATEKVAVSPYLEYKFDDSANPWKNTGTATNGNMTASGGPKHLGWGLKVTENGSNDGGIYLRTQDKNDPLVQTNEFTFSASLYIDGRAGWHSVPISWTSFSTSQKEKVSRTYLLVPNASTSSWLKFGDTDLTDSGKVAQQWYNNEGQEVVPNSATNPGWTNLVVSIKAGDKAYVKARIENKTVYELEYDVPADWTLFDSTNGDDFAFALGASFTYNGSDATKLDESKSKMQFDNVRFYDVAMTETQIDAYISNVADPVYSYKVDIPETDYGVVTADKAQAMLGEKVTFTVTPDAGASISTVKLNGADVSLDGNNQFTATMTKEGMKVDAEFAPPEPTYKAEVRPYIEYTFDSVANFTKNTGTSAKDNTKDYSLKIKGNADANALQYDGYANFGENASLYIPMENNPFVNDLTDFTITVDVNAKKDVAWYSSIFSWDSFTNIGNDTEMDKYSRIDTLYQDKASVGWIALGDKDWKDTDARKLQYYSYAGGKTIYQGDTSASESGLVTIVYSLEQGKTLNIKAYQNGVQVGSVSQDISSWSLYNVNSLYKTFMIGGCYDTRVFTNTTSFTVAQKFKGTMDNIRIYDFAMTAKQMTEYATSGKVLTSGIEIAKSANGKVTVENNAPAIGEEVVLNVTPNAGYKLAELRVNGEVLNAVDGVYKTEMIYDGLYVEATFAEIQPDYTAEVRPYIEYTFDSVANFTKNTGTSAKDNTKDYSLKIKGNADANALQYDGYANFGENASLYIPMENNPFVNDLTDFTITVDVNAKKDVAWYSSIFSWDSFTNIGNDTEMDKYSRIDTLYQDKASVGWIALGDKDWKDTDARKLQYYSYAGGKTIYQGDTSASESGLVTIVYSLEQGKTLNIKAYQNGVQVGSVSQDISSWSLYNANSTYKMFMIGGCYDTRVFTSTTSFTAAQKFKGTMDNIRIYDFAMTEEQMAEYATNKKLTAAGIQIESTENGNASVDNYTPSAGEEVVITPAPKAGYEVDKVFVNGVEIQAVDGVYKTTMTYEGLSVRVTYKETVAAKFSVVSMAHGAGIRYGGTLANSGLRFQMIVSSADYQQLLTKIPVTATVEYGILVIPEDYQSTYGTFTVANLFGANAKYHMAERDEDGNLVEYTGGLPQVMNFWTNELFLNATTGNYEYFGSITQIKPENLARKFVGVGVVKYTENGETQYVIVSYANNDIVNNTRSIYQVAKMAVLDSNLNEPARRWIKNQYITTVESAVSELAGKNLSILGDSISTYKGVSNDANANATIGGNAVCYGKEISSTVVGLDDTWWMQAVNNADMNIVVNNSWAGSNVATNYGNETKGGCTARAENLHDEGGVNPDIVAVYMGINDCGCLTDVGEFNDISDIWDGTQYVGNTEKFATAYATMVHKLTTKYNPEEVFLFTLPRNFYLWKGTKEEYNALQDEYNKMIYKIAEVFGCQVVDLATMVGEKHSRDLLADDIHPNATGMDIITAVFETALYSYYYNN